MATERCDFDWDRDCGTYPPSRTLDDLMDIGESVRTFARRYVHAWCFPEPLSARGRMVVQRGIVRTLEGVASDRFARLWGRALAIAGALVEDAEVPSTAPVSARIHWAAEFTPAGSDGDLTHAERAELRELAADCRRLEACIEANYCPEYDGRHARKGAIL